MPPMTMAAAMRTILLRVYWPSRVGTQDLLQEDEREEIAAHPEDQAGDGDADERADEHAQADEHSQTRMRVRGMPRAHRPTGNWRVRSALDPRIEVVAERSRAVVRREHPPEFFGFARRTGGLMHNVSPRNGVAAGA